MYKKVQSAEDDSSSTEVGGTTIHKADANNTEPVTLLSKHFDVPSAFCAMTSSPAAPPQWPPAPAAGPFGT